MAEKPYSRIYHRLMTEYPSVWHSDAQLGLFARLLVHAEKFYPERPPMPRRNPTFLALIRAGLIIEELGIGYTIKGLEAERERRSDAGRNAAAVRWHGDRNADALPRRDETRIDKTSNGQSPPTSMMRWPPKAPYQPAPGEAARLVHDGKHRDADKCRVCHPLPREVDA